MITLDLLLGITRKNRWLRENLDRGAGRTALLPTLSQLECQTDAKPRFGSTLAYLETLRPRPIGGKYVLAPSRCFRAQGAKCKMTGEGCEEDFKRPVRSWHSFSSLDTPVPPFIHKVQRHFPYAFPQPFVIELSLFRKSLLVEAMSSHTGTTNTHTSQASSDASRASCTAA